MQAARVLAALLFVLAACVSCSRNSTGRAIPPADDEARVRETLAIPPAATLVQLTANPSTSGTFGREGLRIHAVFQLPAGAAATYPTKHRAGDWKPLPAPAALTGLPGDPGALPVTATQGAFLCLVSDWAPGPPGAFTEAVFTTAPTGSCHYWLAVTDPATDHLHVLYKQNY